jgi:catechol 2,3-dioxygenase-like lactoylglutathione lyase family enzyme
VSIHSSTQVRLTVARTGKFDLTKRPSRGIIFLSWQIIKTGVMVMSETTVLGVAEAVLYVSDLDRARQFYTDVLGLPVTSQFEDACFLQTGSDSTLILFDREKLATRVSVIPAHGAQGRGHVCLAIPPEQMDRWRERLIAHGVAIEHERDWSLGTHSIYFRDPDDNSLELIDGRHYQRVWQKLQATHS